MKDFIQKIKTKVKQLFCKHDYQWMLKRPKNTGIVLYNLRGETRYLVCTKCYHEKDSYFAEYEGAGYR